jgi:two-component system OmpR family response regulator
MQDMITKTRILLVEDDPEVRTLLRQFLEREGFRMETAPDGAAMDRVLASGERPDLIVLDIMLPGEDGLSICRRLRATTRLPIILLTARSDTIDRIVGLEIGADDYLPKPFNPRELLARIRAVLRRLETPPLDAPKLKLGALVINMDARSVATTSGTPLSLTSAEFDLLACFVTRPNRVLSRDQLMDWTRGRDTAPLDRTIDVNMSRLRKKLAEAGVEDPFRTIRNAGYMLAVEVERQ